MGVIANVITETEAALTSYPETVFNAVGPSVQLLLTTAGTLSIALLGANLLLQLRPIQMSTYLNWGVRFACIVAFATVWSNFKLLYDVIVGLPTQYSGYLIPATAGTVNHPFTIPAGATDCSTNSGCPWLTDPRFTAPTATAMDGRAGVTQVYSILDDFRERMFGVADEIMDKFNKWKGHTYKYIFSGFIVYIIAIIFTAASIVILLVSKVGLAAAMGLAPLAIGMLTFQATRGYFASWLRFVAGFALVPLLLVSLMAVVVTVADKMTTEGDDLFGGYMPFILVSVAGMVLLFQIPTMASSLASISLPGMGPAMAANALSRVGQFATAPMRALNGAESRVRAGIAGAQASSAGGSNKAVATMMGVRSMLQSSQYRASRFSDNYRNQQTAAGGKSSGNLRSPLGTPRRSG